MISCMISLIISQVAEAEAALKMKIRPVNAFFQCYNFAYLSGLPREELHQFLVGLYGGYIVPSAFHLITSVLRKPKFILSCSDKGVTKYLVSNEMLERVWIRLRDRLSSLDSSTLLLEVTSEYAAHFYDMYVDGHTGKHLTGDRIRILLLNLPFLFRDLIAPEVM
jgi:hypothetical protein